MPCGCYDPVMQTEQIVALLVAERKRFEAAIQTLQGPAKRGKPPARDQGDRHRSRTGTRWSQTHDERGEGGRKAIADAAAEAWAAVKAAKEPSAPVVERKRTLSAAARKAMADAAKKRWEAIKAARPRSFCECEKEDSHERIAFGGSYCQMRSPNWASSAKTDRTGSTAITAVGSIRR